MSQGMNDLLVGLSDSFCAEPHYTDSPRITLLPIKWNTISTGSSKYRSSELKEM